MLAIDDAEEADLLSWLTPLESDALRTLLALDALRDASFVNDVYDEPARSFADVADAYAWAPIELADLLICDGSRPCLWSSLEIDLLATDDAEAADLLAWA